MTNDAKLGMLAGLLGVVVAAVVFANAPPAAQSQPGPAAQLPPNEKPAPPTSAVASAQAAVPSDSYTAELPSTPVVRTRKEVDAQPASRQGGLDEEP